MIISRRPQFLRRVQNLNKNYLWKNRWKKSSNFFLATLYLKKTCQERLYRFALTFFSIVTTKNLVVIECPRVFYAFSEAAQQWDWPVTDKRFRRCRKLVLRARRYSLRGTARSPSRLCTLQRAPTEFLSCISNKVVETWHEFIFNIHFSISVLLSRSFTLTNSWCRIFWKNVEIHSKFD